ncbi:glycoside hydrolase family 13 protein [Candidatus Izemoplasma sp. B36]|uniref:glycoside hydrolase family 13 protein n=1 Tax=Candidatus Izemoplasma sp. B36 TaxID=3242468 RepID=UPI003556210B
MINRQAIYHKPLSNYAFALDESTLIIRLRTARNDVDCVYLFFGDTAYQGNPVKCSFIEMKVVRQDKYFDYYEATIKNAYRRTVYYFNIEDKDESLIYYSDVFSDKVSDMRNDLYKFPYIRREDIVDTPEWLKDAVIYNIFPDSFISFDKSNKKEISHHGLQIKSNHGGNLREIISNLDYIQDLGCNTIYLNPIFTGGEYHKYDVINYKEIDPLLGTNETFKELVEKSHARNMKVIIDGVFNHSGWNFFAFLDVLKNQENSKYKDWYYELNFPVKRPTEKEKQPTYACFAYEKRMPKLNTSNPEVIDYFMDVCRYWIKEYNIDGWRLDVADEVNLDFWRKFKETAVSINPEIVLIGEVWQDATYFLDGSMFNSTMNYDFLKHAKAFFTGSIDAYDFDARVTNMLIRYRENLNYGQLNLLDSHDVPRFLSVINGNKDIYKLSIIFLLTNVGAPSIFYGDEQSFTGVLESEYRRPMNYLNDIYMFNFFKEIITLRNQYISLRRGSFTTLRASKNEGLYIYKRKFKDESIIIVLNNSNQSITMDDYLLRNRILSKSGLDYKQLSSYGYVIFKESR